METILNSVYIIMALSIFIISIGSFITGFIILIYSLKSLFNNCEDKLVDFCAIIFLFPLLISFSMVTLLLSLTITYEITKYADFLLKYEYFNSIHEFFEYNNNE